MLQRLLEAQQRLQQSIPDSPALQRRAHRRHLRSDRLTFAAFGPRMADFASSLANDTPAPISYTSEKPAGILAEDARVATRPLHIHPSSIRIIDAAHVFA